MIILFGIVGHILFPLCDRARNKLMYNIKKRTHPLLSAVILIKYCFVWVCLLYNSYHYIMNLSWYYLIPIFTVYLLALVPSLVHGIYFLNAIQSQIN